MNNIVFHSSKFYNKFNLFSEPSLSKKHIPKWFLNAKRHLINPISNSFIINEQGGKELSFKACPALMDIYTSGYMLTTPCDLVFYKENNYINVKTEEGFEDFCSRRSLMDDFVSPFGYNKIPFHWYPSWAPEVPDGYSVLYLSPVNRFDLPFLTVGGIIDNDKINTPGLLPFFLRDDFIGTVPAGTPYVQIIPFKREKWEMSSQMHTEEEIEERRSKSKSIYRTKTGGAYKKHTWSKKTFN